MASSIIGGLVPDILPSTAISVFDPNPEQLARLNQQFGTISCADNHELIQRSDVIVLAVKPQVMAKVLAPIANDIAEKQPLLISIAAGISDESIQDIIQQAANTTGSALPVIRVMPNTPALVKSGASGMYANSHVSDVQKDIAHTLMSAVGSAFWVKQEKDIDTVTALSGSGPAYFMLFIQSLIQSAEHAGLPSEVAKQLAIDTCAGSAKLIQASDASIAQLISNVTSPGGTTEQALQSFHNNQLTHIVDQAFNAALHRSEELAEELAKEL